MQKNIFILIIIFVIGISACPKSYSLPILNNDESIVVSVYEKIMPSIVTVDAQLSDGISSGTGCIVGQNGIILTSSHVIDGANSIDITLYSGKTYSASVISILGKNNDLALLKIDTKEQLKIVPLGDSSAVKVGQKVLSIGNPFGFSGTLTEGIISRIDYVKNKIQTDAAINPGCSGGPLLNLKGEVIGISQSIYNPDNNKSNIGIGFAIPVNSVKEFLQLAKIAKKI